MIATVGTERLVLRPLVPGDAAALHAAFSDPILMHWWSSGPHVCVEETERHVARALADTKARIWGITQRGGEALGWVVLTEQRAAVHEIGYLLRRDLWGQGLGREAAVAIINHGFQDIGIRRIFADVDPENVQSVGLLRSMGFIEEGRLRAEWETHIGVRDSLIFGLLRDEWKG